LQEALRRRIFHVVLLLTALYLVLYWLGANTAFNEVAKSETGGLPVDQHELTGGTLFGLSMFGTLFLGAVLAAFLTLGVIRGDAERGLLQPLVVRPIGRAQVLSARFGAAAIVSGAYVLVVYAGAVVATGIVGDWWPDHIVVPGLSLAAAVIVVAALSTA